MDRVSVDGPAVFHLVQAINAIQKELQTVPPFSIDRQTRMAEVAQLRDMIDRRVKLT